MAIDLPVVGQQNWGEPLNVALRDMDVTRPGSLAEAELSSRLSAAAGSAEGMVQAAITASRPILYGSGFPNGKVAAPVGTLYADEAVTNGASLWQKITGTGNTGWQVVRGDTGWRKVQAEMHEVTGGLVEVRRENNLISVRAESLTHSVSVGGGIVLPMSQGWVAGRGSRLPFGLTPVGALVAGMNMRWNAPSVIEIYALGQISGYGSYPTTDAWPTTLPGTN